jgi:hypothetical protein
LARSLEIASTFRRNAVEASIKLGTSEIALYWPRVGIPYTTSAVSKSSVSFLLELT